MKDEDIQQLYELVASVREAERSLEKMRGSIDQMKATMEELAQNSRLRRKLHENWPELCNCKECDEVRISIAQIRKDVLG